MSRKTFVDIVSSRVSSIKPKVMLVKTLNKVKSCIMYKNEPLETIESFQNLGLENLCR